MIWWFLFLLMILWLIKFGFAATSIWWTVALALLWISFFVSMLLTPRRHDATDATTP